MKKKTILIVDDHPLILDAVVLSLSARDTSVFTASDFKSISVACDAPDFVIVDLALPGMMGIQAVYEAKRLWPRAKVVVLSASDNRNVIFAAIDAGAMGFIPKSYSARALVSAMEEVIEGKIHVPTSITAENSADERVLSSLTPRQKELLSYLLCGYSNKEIVRCTGLSEKTVKFYLTGLFRLLKVKNRTSAVLFAAKAGFILGSNVLTSQRLESNAVPT